MFSKHNLMIRFTPLLLALFTLPLSAAQEKKSSEEIYDRIYAQLSYCGNIDKSPSSNMIIAVEDMLHTPYVAGTLSSGDEELIIDLTQTDCILLIENSLAAVADAETQFPSYDNFKYNIQRLRYRNGVIDGFESRIHYTSEWISQAERMGYFKEITREIGGVEFDEEFSFMSNNPHLYPQLSNNPELVDKIRDCEERLNSAQSYYMIPKEMIESKLSSLNDGDIVAFVTSIKGLDISHIGMIRRVGERVTFIHASSKLGEVILHPTNLVDYVNSINNICGLRIIRL